MNTNYPKTLAVAVGVLAFVAFFATFASLTRAHAGGPGVPSGTWCESQTNGADGWRYFRRSSGKCIGATLVLQSNGDYVLNDNESTQRCKVDPKSYFKGWADYTCTFRTSEGGRNQSSTTTHNQRFTIADGVLGFNAD
jgi:hypothetical protein